jgi:hypothetical protein
MSATTPQKSVNSPMPSRATVPTALSSSRAEVRRRSSRLTTGVSSPPTIWAPALIAATRPAIPYARGSPHSCSRYGCRA